MVFKIQQLHDERAKADRMFISLCEQLEGPGYDTKTHLPKTQLAFGWLIKRGILDRLIQFITKGIALPEATVNGTLKYWSRKIDEYVQLGGNIAVIETDKVCL